MPSRRKGTAKTSRARKSDAVVTGSVAPVGVIQPERVEHAIAHTARIQRKLDENPNHKGRAQFEQALADYQELIDQAGPAALRAAHENLRARGIHDLTHAHMAASVRHLEG